MKRVAVAGFPISGTPRSVDPRRVVTTSVTRLLSGGLHQASLVSDARWDAFTIFRGLRARSTANETGRVVQYFQWCFFFSKKVFFETNNGTGEELPIPKTLGFRRYDGRSQFFAIRVTTSSKQTAFATSLCFDRLGCQLTF